MSRGPPPEGGCKYTAGKDKRTMAGRKQEGLLTACVRYQFTRLKGLFHSGEDSPGTSVRRRQSTLLWGLCILGPLLLPVVTLHTRDPPSDPDSSPPMHSSPPAMARARLPAPENPHVPDVLGPFPTAGAPEMLLPAWII